MNESEILSVLSQLNNILANKKNLENIQNNSQQNDTQLANNQGAIYTQQNDIKDQNNNQKNIQSENDSSQNNYQGPGYQLPTESSNSHRKLYHNLSLEKNVIKPVSCFNHQKQHLLNQFSYKHINQKQSDTKINKSHQKLYNKSPMKQKDINFVNQDELENCTFTPKINKKSQILAQCIKRTPLYQKQTRSISVTPLEQQQNENQQQFPKFTKQGDLNSKSQMNEFDEDQIRESAIREILMNTTRQNNQNYSQSLDEVKNNNFNKVRKTNFINDNKNQMNNFREEDTKFKEIKQKFGNKNNNNNSKTNEEEIQNDLNNESKQEQILQYQEQILLQQQDNQQKEQMSQNENYNLQQQHFDQQQENKMGQNINNRNQQFFQNTLKLSQHIGNKSGKINGNENEEQQQQQIIKEIQQQLQMKQSDQNQKNTNQIQNNNVNNNEIDKITNINQHYNVISEQKQQLQFQQNQNNDQINQECQFPNLDFIYNIINKNSENI
ncbi:hypothetical protein PPERSA_05813 [Pseudocohnilembus persalinus]|uniref:Uncharacterized protein n=1 Tax=Pseudocohnilembus persalinus TaxID=266149 RepID=A0A0V0QG92_PSEPJ|nr:hypothetical protein PPERSA_05813 [Pseudocohnilembus persalinus]|eukprot:KRX01227.1 hypothetical protein PPERSA_05813 [Pseudocohnilembus persalinus]